MRNSRLIPTAIAAILALGAAGTAFAESGEHENGEKKEMTAVVGAKTSVAQAIAAAEQKTGGRALKVDIEKEKGAYVYEVKTISKDKVSEVFVDLTSGAVTRTHDEGLIARMFDRQDQDELASLSASSTTLATAVATAEQHVGGKAIEAGFDDENGAMIFKIKVAKDNAVHRVVVDSTTGKVMQVAAGQDGEHED